MRLVDDQLVQVVDEQVDVVFDALSKARVVASSLAWSAPRFPVEAMWNFHLTPHRCRAAVSRVLSARPLRAPTCPYSCWAHGTRFLVTRAVGCLAISVEDLMPGDFKIELDGAIRTVGDVRHVGMEAPTVVVVLVTASPELCPPPTELNDHRHRDGAGFRTGIKTSGHESDRHRPQALTDDSEISSH